MRSHSKKSAMLSFRHFLLATVCVVSVAGCSSFRSLQVNGDKRQTATSIVPWGDTAATLETANGRIVNVEADYGLLKAETIRDTVYIKVAHNEIVVTPTTIQVNARIAKVLTPDISDVDLRIKSDGIEFVVGGERFVHNQ